MDAPAPRATDDSKPHELDTARIAREQVARSNFDLRTGAMVTLAVLAVFYTFYFAAELILP
ncbi:MAG: AI-2E family transporter, partial [Acetobacteraceae bacterium]|nr:AI-2E family transporter [Acetobacteraceae bacterium]